MGLGTVEFIMRVEQEFGVDIDDSDAANIVTVGDLLEYMTKRFANDMRFNQDVLSEKIIEIIEDQAGAPREIIMLSSSFVDDLGMD